MSSEQIRRDLQDQLAAHQVRNQGIASSPAHAFSAPARVNLIGEHTDYTGGFVLPLAIGFRTIAVVTPRSDDQAVLYSSNFNETAQYDLRSLALPPRGHWSDYPIGVAWGLQQQGIRLTGFNLSIDGNVPLGSGLSSSASIEVATAMALLDHSRSSLTGEQIALLCQKIENVYVGSPCGIMDQFVITNAIDKHALMLDCRSLSFDHLPLATDARIVICNSMVKHSIADGEYGDRRGEVERGQEILRQRNPAIQLLRDATIADLEAARTEMSEASYRRCKHIITENDRVIQTREALTAGDERRFGQLMFTAHASMRDDFAASCEEIDALVEIARTLPGCLGARITGGGFGGCTVNLVDAAHAEEFALNLKAKYREQYGIDAQTYVCEAVDGALARATQ